MQLSTRLINLSILLVLLLILSLLASCQPAPSTGVGLFQVVKVIDGDTIVVAGGMRVRYIGINAPEMAEPWGEAARQANRELVGGKLVRLERDVSDTDRFSRWLRYVYVDGRMVNGELVRLGLARARAYAPDTKYHDYLVRLEDEARQARRGLWAR